MIVSGIIFYGGLTDMWMQFPENDLEGETRHLEKIETRPLMSDILVLIITLLAILILMKELNG